MNIYKKLPEIITLN